jgi:hypothetical protein
MRIIIPGKITALRMAEMLIEAATLYGAEFDSFYTANVYITGYTKDGEVIKALDGEGQEIVHRMKLAPTSLKAPPITGDAYDRLGEQKRTEARLVNKVQIALEEKAIARRPEPTQAAASLLCHHRKEEQLQMLLEECGAKLLEAMNKELEMVWGKVEPVIKQGKNAGMPRPIPCFASEDGQMMLLENRDRMSFAKRCRIIDGVFSRSQPEAAPKPYFANEAWSAAIPRINEVIKAFAARAASVATSAPNPDVSPSQTTFSKKASAPA